MSKPRIAIVGIGETPNARHLAEDLPTLAVQAIEAAVADAGLAISDIDGIVSEYFVSPALVYDLVSAFGWPEDIFSAHIGLCGAGTVASPLLAKMAIEAGLAKNIVCYFGVKWGTEAAAFSSHHSEDPYKANLEMPFGFFPQAAYMAAMANRYLAEYGYDRDDLARVSMTQRRWSSMHPEASKRELLTLEQYHASPMVSDPYHNADCALLSDGAAAFVMTTEDVAADLRQTPVVVAGCARSTSSVTEHAYLGVRPDLLSLPSSSSGPRALKAAGMTPDDIDVAELYDCFSIIPVIQLEDIGFCERGAGLGLYRDGVTAPGGRLPVNTHGGLTCHSYLLGISHLCEAVKQLRGDAADRQVPGARHALVGGWAGPEHSTAVLTVGG
jgi:acetyl-CoA acetyltransferase